MRRTLWIGLIAGGLAGLGLGTTLRLPEAVAQKARDEAQWDYKVGVFYYNPGERTDRRAAGRRLRAGTQRAGAPGVGAGRHGPDPRHGPDRRRGDHHPRLDLLRRLSSQARGRADDAVHRGSTRRRDAVAITSLHVAGCPDDGKMSIWRLHGCHCRCDRPRIAARPASPRLNDARRAIVIISKAFLASSWSRQELDGLTTRSGVVAILPDIIEADVAGRSPGLAVAPSPGSPSERLVCLLRAGEETGSFE